MKADYGKLQEKFFDGLPVKDREAAFKWFLEKRAAGLAYNSLRTYCTILNILSELSSKPLLECNREDTLEVLVEVQERFESPTLYKHVLRDFFRIFGQEDVISRISLNRRKKKREWQDPAKVLGRHDIQKMLDATTDPRDRAIVAVLWDTGARCHEIAAIEIGDLKIESREDPKTGKPLYSVWFREQKIAGEERRIVLYESSPFIFRSLRVHPDPGDPKAPLFVSRRKGVRLEPLGTSGIRTIVRSIGSKARIRKPVHPHAFRHARATFLKSKGISDDAIRAYMGWVRDSDMPMRYISRKDVEKMREVATRLGFEPLPPPGPIEELALEDIMPVSLSSKGAEDFGDAMRHMARAIDILFKTTAIDPQARKELEECKRIFETEGPE
ncbi:MAG: tyrosine-type recombinase/integrase [Thermoplasmata archaeon]